jgi:hypothetical protein
MGGGGGASSNPAEMLFEPSEPAPVISTVQVDSLPEEAQSPPQPENVAFPSGAAVNVTVEPCFISAEQVPGQSIEVLVESGAGAVTRPGPVTETVTW